jgi:preprotein translocase subunit SecE
MNAKVEQQSSILDTLRLLLAVLIVIAGIGGFYHFDTESMLYRVLALLAVVAVAIGVASTSLQGKTFWRFAFDARTEVRKVIWPTRPETIQSTLIVLLVVLLIGLFLWGVDSLLGWTLRSIIGTGA